MIRLILQQSLYNTSTESRRLLIKSTSSIRAADFNVVLGHQSQNINRHHIIGARHDINRGFRGGPQRKERGTTGRSGRGRGRGSSHKGIGGHSARQYIRNHDHDPSYSYAGRGRGGNQQGRGRGGGRGREGSVAGRGRNDKPPTVARGKMKSITVAASKSKGSGGSTKYCYGCGATIVKKNDIDVQTEEAGGKIRYNNDDSGNNVRMGLKASSGGMYPFVLNIYCIC